MRYGAQLGALGSDDTVAQLARARELGCEGLEVSMDVAALHRGDVVLDELLEQAAALRDDFRQAGMAFIALSPGILLKHAECPGVVEAVGHVAETLDVRQIRMFSAPHVRWGGPASVLDEWMADFDGTRDPRYWMERNGRELDTLLELTEPFTLRFVFELHGGYVVNSASGAMRMLDRHPPDRVGIIMDPGNMVFEGNEGWRNSVQIMGEYLAYIHCKNAIYRRDEGRWAHQWASLEEGIADYGEIVTALKDIDFAGYLCIEDLRRDVSVEDKVGKGIRYLKSLVQSQARVMPV